ncbi:hypothetical protein RJ639_033812 [Escallonia herrerae]|uniref:Ripening-related protein 1 n=1 Tax=Escallonia herrerae TaxID=1293975 RepID=A0AA88WUT6_9ASTE|nr:hypothetical protein RJ639_033812 [Escallonia herrerae]
MLPFLLRQLKNPVVFEAPVYINPETNEIPTAPKSEATFSLNFTRMKKQVCFSVAHLQVLLLVVIFMAFTTAEGQTCRPSGRVRGRKPPKNQCNTDNGADCCKEGHFYSTYECSPPVSGHTKAILTINDFQKDGDGGAPSECDGHYHSNKKPVVALSTGWFNHMKRCHKFINIHGNGRTARAMVVDECDSTMGCDKEHAYQPPCTNNIVDASKAVWEALGIPENSPDWGWLEITWSDA